MRINLHVLSKLALLALCLLALIAYWPGLRGGFLFDDYGSLPLLGASGPVTDWATFWRYITSGTADPTGRPLAMLTFLLDAHNWPADPFSFKRTNLMLHLCNGALLYALLVRFGDLLALDRTQARVAAYLGCALWLLHPLLVSTTLYIVQREALLVATCTLTGLLLWLHGRRQLLDGYIKSGTTWSIAGLAGFTLLGTLAKANGSLLPLYALLIEVVLLHPRLPVKAHACRRAHHVVLIVFCGIPAAAVLGYVLWTGIHGLWAGGAVGVRSWSIGQRLLTEPRVLIDYLQLLWLPRPFSTGLFNDQYVVSGSWLKPASTLPALIAVWGLVAAAWWKRCQHPALALAVLFFFTGQLLESTSIPLELFFEHRNYTPALLMFWPLGLWMGNKRQLRRLKAVLLIALPLTLAWMTHARAVVWGNVQTQAMVWAQINPHSPRAQANAAEVTMYQGHPQAAAEKLEALLALQPDQAQLAFNLIDARCWSGSVRTGDLQTTRKALRHTANTGSLFVSWFARTLPLATSGGCHGLTSEAMLGLIDAASMNSRLQAVGQRQDRQYLRGLVALSRRRPDAALADFFTAVDLLPNPGVALKAAAALGQQGYPAQGLRLLDHYQHLPQPPPLTSLNMVTLHQWVLRRQHYWPHEIARLRSELEQSALKVSTDNIPLSPQPVATP